MYEKPSFIPDCPIIYLRVTKKLLRNLEVSLLQYIYTYIYIYMCVCVCVRARARVCMHTSARFPASYYETSHYKLQTLNLRTLSSLTFLFYK